MLRSWDEGSLSPLCGQSPAVGGLEQQREETRGLITKSLSAFAKETLFFGSSQLEGDFLLLVTTSDQQSGVK